MLSDGHPSVERDLLTSRLWSARLDRSASAHSALHDHRPRRAHSVLLLPVPKVSSRRADDSPVSFSPSSTSSAERTSCRGEHIPASAPHRKASADHARAREPNRYVPVQQRAVSRAGVQPGDFTGGYVLYIDPFLNPSADFSLLSLSIYRASSLANLVIMRVRCHASSPPLPHDPRLISHAPFLIPSRSTRASRPSSPPPCAPWHCAPSSRATASPFLASSLLPHHRWTPSRLLRTTRRRKGQQGGLSRSCPPSSSAGHQEEQVCSRALTKDLW